MKSPVRFNPDKTALIIEIPQMSGKSNFERFGENCGNLLLEEGSGKEEYIQIKRAQAILVGYLRAIQDSAGGELVSYIGDEVRGAKIAKGSPRPKYDFESGFEGFNEIKELYMTVPRQIEDALKTAYKNYTNNPMSPKAFTRDIIDENTGELVATITDKNIPEVSFSAGAEVKITI